MTKGSLKMTTAYQGIAYERSHASPDWSQGYILEAHFLFGL